MGLFNRNKNNGANSAGESGQTEFERDVRELLARDDIQCRQDICEAEYAKAQCLLEKPTQETVRRAYDLMGNLAAQFEYVPAIMWMGDFAESAMQNLEQAAFWYKKAADLGDGAGARCYADMLMFGNGVARNPRLAMNYYSFAADHGIPEAAFVMGEFLRNAGDTKTAIKAYQQAYDGGYAPALGRIKQIKGE